MNCSLHAEALGDLSDAASRYRAQVAHSLFNPSWESFEQSINKLLLHLRWLRTAPRSTKHNKLHRGLIYHATDRNGF